MVKNIQIVEVCISIRCILEIKFSFIPTLIGQLQKVLDFSNENLEMIIFQQDNSSKKSDR